MLFRSAIVILRWIAAPTPRADASLTRSGTPGGAAFARTGKTADGSQDPGMNRSIAAALMVSGIASGAGAQQAVQWKVSDGGNGHWFRVVVIVGGISWTSAKEAAHALGGTLAMPKDGPEDAFCWALVSANDAVWNGVPGDCNT